MSEPTSSDVSDYARGWIAGWQAAWLAAWFALLRSKH